MYIYMYIYIYVYKYLYTYIHTCMCIYIHGCIYSDLFVYANISFTSMDAREVVGYTKKSHVRMLFQNTF